ncbi:hypothetical protein BJ138DRAFT_1116613 [Hygrophoropsis aurantiaca]|uniref:Uncharacterized protein n=1 Tax=Hygrophoropsis aurantiaca TaxID=72124 RepID=A0ACB8A2X8_9AGAM|nr:hypothetical protein BJ138DRAFT_1116613 [Hygrophoropsis aurantiaca]
MTSLASIRGDLAPACLSCFAFIKSRAFATHASSRSILQTYPRQETKHLAKLSPGKSRNGFISEFPRVAHDQSDYQPIIVTSSFAHASTGEEKKATIGPQLHVPLSWGDSQAITAVVRVLLTTSQLAGARSLPYFLGEAWIDSTLFEVSKKQPATGRWKNVRM